MPYPLKLNCQGRMAISIPAVRPEKGTTICTFNTIQTKLLGVLDQ